MARLNTCETDARLARFGRSAVGIVDRATIDVVAERSPVRAQGGMGQFACGSSDRRAAGLVGRVANRRGKTRFRARPVAHGLLHDDRSISRTSGRLVRAAIVASPLGRNALAGRLAGSIATATLASVLGSRSDRSVRRECWTS